MQVNGAIQDVQQVAVGVEFVDGLPEHVPGQVERRIDKCPPTTRARELLQRLRQSLSDRFAAYIPSESGSVGFISEPSRFGEQVVDDLPKEALYPDVAEIGHPLRPVPHVPQFCLWAVKRARAKEIREASGGPHLVVRVDGLGRVQGRNGTGDTLDPGFLRRGVAPGFVQPLQALIDQGLAIEERLKEKGLDLDARSELWREHSRTQGSRLGN